MQKLVVLWGFDARISGEEAVFIMKRLVYVDWWCQEARATRLRARRCAFIIANDRALIKLQESLNSAYM